MLKALELVGFKSFADKTRFEFPPGITVVVGPNGSGKSNIVDAIKWVLGEQSAKSLRGKDMADVIFKGGGSGRKPMNTAEATIVIDNSDGRIAVDAPEVHVTRRVYRSGEGEYLINQQPCRLRDVRDLFRGTGVGTDAYSLIEQGKVDRLLQASAKERRAIFEEAAGISRFKAKKIEAQRRLERVEQNLVRLADIVEEVESRLRSIRNQATKARRYREYSDRLQQLRTQVGLSDWRNLTEKLDVCEAEEQRLRAEVEQLNAELEGANQQIREAEQNYESAGEQLREKDGLQTEVRERIAGLETASRYYREQTAELQQRISVARSRLVAMNGRADDAEDRLEQTRHKLAQVEASHGEIEMQVEQQDASLRELDERIKTIREEVGDIRLRHVEQVKQVARLENERTVRKTERDAHRRQLESTEGLRSELDDAVAEVVREATALQQEIGGIESELGESREVLQATEREVEELRRVFQRRQQELAVQQGRLSGKQERAALLKELEQRREGLDQGVRQVLDWATDKPNQAADNIYGMVADVIEAKVETAHLIDLILGPQAQFIVMGTESWFQQYERRFRLKGRIGVYFLDQLPALPSQPAELQQIADFPGVLSRVDALISAAERFQPLVEALFGDTWLVQSLDVARTLRDRGTTARWVTTSGEVMDRQGALSTGPAVTLGGLISRRSELQALEQEMEIISTRILDEEVELQRLQENMGEHERRVSELTEKHRQWREQIAESRVLLNAQQQQQADLAGRIERLASERKAAQDAVQEQETALQDIGLQTQRLEEENAELEAQLQDADQEVGGLELQRQQVTRQVTESRILFAKSEQELAAVTARMSQFLDDNRERQRALLEAQQVLDEGALKRQEADVQLLQAAGQLALLYLDKEKLELQTLELVQRQVDCQAQKTQLQEETSSRIRKVRRSEKELHKQELAAGELRHQRVTLAERLMEDYGIDIAQHTEVLSDEEQKQREDIDEEISALRRKINNIGAVNMEALHELDELESRFGGLHTQYQDLVEAKNALERIIVRINSDSRRLFVDTLEAIRANFQVLYRKAFGGGQADIVLEEGVDPLEAGIEIIATPPGKPSFNNSLLSGGEKALTAVSLLMGIFQFRPSPFCVLDEVDAPFDEANIGRFVDVLKDFLGWTRFVIVTHSKKTMTAATTLYGVTMQESGVSKQVSVQFDDVRQDGEIDPAALERPENQDDAA